MTSPVWRPSRLAPSCLVAVAVGASLVLLGGMPAVAGIGAVAPGPDLVVDATGPGGHAISSDIYGVNFVPAKLGRQIDVPVDRWGGDSAETYNWLIGADNSGADWYFEDISDCWTATYAYCSGHKTNNVRAYVQQIELDRSLGATTLLQLPMAGGVARFAPVAQPLPCAYPKSVYPHQDAFDSYDPNCGDGLDHGKRLTGILSRVETPINAAWDRRWVQSLVKQFGPAAKGGVGIYELGNEPSLWGQTHADIQPRPETANELITKSIALASAVKQVDPSAAVLGFSEWGWIGYFCSEADTYGSGCSSTACTTSADCANHGHLPMAEWYLQQFARYDAKTHLRHLDYFDVHYYAQGGNSTEVTRSLWDPTYTDPSWIDEKIALIPRLRCWVDGHVPGLCPNADGYYPGTKISISEYDLSLAGVGAQANAIIEADTLGIFARENVSLACHWAQPVDGDELDDAFLMYRDYDGHGSEFGDEWVDSTSADQAEISVYGARRSSDGVYTVMVINKSSQTLQSTLQLKGGISGAVHAWQWDGGPIKQVATPSRAGNALTTTYPPLSMTLYVVG